MTTPRTIAGLIAPIGKVGRTSVGNLQIDGASFTWSDPSRVKLLIEHDPNRAIGYALELTWASDGLRGVFAVDDTPDALAALASASRMVRDGFSFGAELTPECTAAVLKSPAVKSGTIARGTLREVSLVAVPAFDDSRVDDVTTPDTDTAAAAAPLTITTPPGATMPSNITTATGGRLATAAAPTGLTLAAGALAAQAETTTTETPAAPAAAPAPDPAAATAAAPAAGTETAAATAAPTPPPAAAAGSVFTAHDAAEYRFDGTGEHSFVRDVFAAAGGDIDAAGRLYRFQRSIRDDTSAQASAIAELASRVQADGRLASAAVEVRDAGTEHLRPMSYRNQDLLREIDKGRPLVSRVRQLPLSGPDPFRVPVLGAYDGVGDHTEGTAHVTEGTMADVTAQLVVPTAVSGAYRLSRELAESSSALKWDGVVLAEMIKDYRDQSEFRLVAKLETVKATADGVVGNAQALLGQLIDFQDVRHAPPTVAALGSGAFRPLAITNASDGRPYFPYLGPSNASGTSAAAFAALNIQGIPGVPVWSVDATDIWLVHGPDVAVFESAPRTFRFEEVEGPGIIKLAIWGYQAAHVYRVQGVRRLSYT